MVLKLIAQRVALGILLLLAVSVLIFVGTNLLPSDVAQSILGPSATPLALANLRREMGLNDPAYVRYLRWLFGILQGDLGTALTSGLDIAASIKERLWNTLSLAFWAAIIAVPLAIILGLSAVRHRDSLIDKLITGLALASTSVPEFFIGYLLVYFFAVKFHIFPGISMVYEGMPVLDKMKAIAMPCTTLTLGILAHMMRMTRAAILNVMQSAYVETAELKGLSAFAVIRKHAFPNAIAPIINVIMLNLAYLVVGVVVVEVIFVYPGMGQYLVDHVAKRDVPVVQAVGLIFAAVYISFNVVADVASILANPRLRHPR
ncbi:ABC transporter permease [Mesorhizobium sp. M0208]|uniref:ABC transporter permease n=1 Tax=Mesorhizobium sp. M0208 TaxID=2956916 RepID=UPI003336AE92